MAARKAAVAVLVVAVWLAPLWFVRQELATVDEMSGISDPALPVYARAERVVVDERTAAVAELVYGEPDVLRAPGWRGAVTGVPLRSGQSVRSGDTVVAIDGIDRLAVHSDEPFHRRLQLRDRGADVARLQTVLRELFGETEIEADGVYGRSTALAVRRLSKRLGAEAVDRFDPAWFVWLPSAEFAVETSELAVAAPAPGAGAVVAASAAEATRLEITAGDGSPLVLDPTSRWQFVSAAGDVFEIDWAAGSSADDSAAPRVTRDLDALTGNPTRILGHVELVEPIEALAVGSSAITVDDSGTACVWAGRGSPPEVSARLVAVLRSTVGVAWIDGKALATDEDILVNPSSFVGDRACT